MPKPTRSISRESVGFTTPWMIFRTGTRRTTPSISSSTEKKPRPKAASSISGRLYTSVGKFSMKVRANSSSDTALPL